MYTHIYIYQGLSGHPNVYIQKYMCPQASTTPRYKNRLTSLYTTKKIYIIHQSWCLYRTTTCSSLRRRWWPTTTCPRRWWTTHRTLLPRRQASTSHRSKHCCSPHYGPPWWRYPHTLLQEALILDRVHMPSGTSCNTVSRRRRISSKSTPAAAGGACDGPAPGSSNRTPPRCPLGLCWSTHDILPPPPLSLRSSLWLSLSWRSLHLHLAPARCHICTCKKQQQKIVSASISHTYGLISQKQHKSKTCTMLNIPRWSKTSPGGSTMSGSPRKSTPA
jgi:hypothetical protein